MHASWSSRRQVYWSAIQQFVTLKSHVSCFATFNLQLLLNKLTAGSHDTNTHTGTLHPSFRPLHSLISTSGCQPYPYTLSCFVCDSPFPLSGGVGELWVGPDSHFLTVRCTHRIETRKLNAWLPHLLSSPSLSLCLWGINK